jgi:hypothetical protein
MYTFMEVFFQNKSIYIIHICKLHNLKVIDDQILSKTTSKYYIKGVYGHL